MDKQNQKIYNDVLNHLPDELKSKIGEDEVITEAMHYLKKNPTHCIAYLFGAIYSLQEVHNTIHREINK